MSDEEEFFCAECSIIIEESQCPYCGDSLPRVEDL